MNFFRFRCEHAVRHMCSEVDADGAIYILKGKYSLSYNYFLLGNLKIAVLKNSKVLMLHVLA